MPENERGEPDGEETRGKGIIRGENKEKGKEGREERRRRKEKREGKKGEEMRRGKGAGIGRA